MIYEIERRWGSWFFGHWLTEKEQIEYFKLMDSLPITPRGRERIEELEFLCRDRCLAQTTMDQRSAKGVSPEDLCKA